MTAESDFRVTCEAGGQGVSVSARLYAAAAGNPATWLVLAPGAGAGHDHPFMVTFGRGLASRGLHVVTFNFPYFERGRHVPDPNATLEACWLSVLAAVRQRAGAGVPLFAGGKSMGGRIASQVASQAAQSALDLDGLVFLGYPLHPPGKPEQRRTRHWPDIQLPALFVQGSRDPFASPDELRADLPHFGGDARLMIVEEGDHSLKVPRRSGRTQDSVYAEVQDAVADWIRGVMDGRAPRIRARPER
jgi:uncharacterized protein